MQPTTFNLLDVVSVLKKSWRAILVFVFFCLAIVTAILFFLPKYYKATTVAVVQNPLLADKSRWFNTNIQNLYSFLGNGDDLDVVYGISKLDIIYYQLVDEFKLVDYYQSNGRTPDKKRRNAFLELKDDLEIKKNETNLLSIVAFAKSPELSANIANRATELVQLTQQNIWKKNYQLVCNQLVVATLKMEKQIVLISDTIKMLPPTNVQQLLLINARQALLEQVQKYRKEAGDLQLAIESTPAALVVLDKAAPSTVAAKPDKLLILVATFFIALCIGVTSVLFLERKNN